MNSVSSDDIFDATIDKAGPPRPTPDNFDEYLPWACHQLELGIDITIINVQIGQRSNVKKPKDSKKKPPRVPSILESNVEPDHTKKKREPGKSVHNISDTESFTKYHIKLYTIYNNENLVQLKFDNNKSIPVKLLKVIALILQFHSFITNITINRGLYKAAIEELLNILLLPMLNITDLCLDDTDIVDANYDVLLQKGNHLKQLSLSRCKIDDTIVHKIALKLTHPLPASKTLTILNLTSNRITDMGAKYIAEVLRTNRQLAFLNLADNLITDTGARAILEYLCKFNVTHSELIESRSRYILYWKQKQELLSRPIVEQSVVDIKKTKRKSMKPTTTNSMAKKNNVVEKDEIFFKKEESFKDPFCSENIFIRDDKIQCYGNNQLAYLNLSYNDISYLTVKKLLKVLIAQKALNRKPRGLINVVIEGNSIPMNCTELMQIDEILQAVLQT